MATETIVAAAEKMGIMESGDGDHTAVATAMENSIILVAIAIAVWASLYGFFIPNHTNTRISFPSVHTAFLCE